MAKGDLLLGQTTATLQLLSAYGRTFSINNKLLAVEDRTVSGKLVRDIIATKKIFTLAYKMIDGNDLTTLINIYNINDELILRYYTGAATYEDYTVLMEPVDYKRILLIDDGLWGGVKVVLKEV